MRRRFRGRFRLALLALVGLCVFSASARGQANPDYVLSLGSAFGDSGDAVVVTSRLDFVGSVSLAGFSFGVCHEQFRLNPLSAALGATAATIDGGSPPAFVQINVIPFGEANPGFTPGVNMGLVISAVGSNPLPPGNGYELLDIEYELVFPGTTTVTYCETTQGAADGVDVVLDSEGGAGSITPTVESGRVVIHPVERYTLRLTDATGGTGSEQTANVRFDISSIAPNVAGWSYSVCHDPSLVDVVSVAQGATTQGLNGGTGPAFEQVIIIPNGDEPIGTEPGISVGVVISFLGVNPLTAGTGYDLREITYLLEGQVGSSAAIATCDNVFGVTHTIATQITCEACAGPVVPAQIGGTIFIVDVAAFERGDCSADAIVDIADAMRIAEYLFNFGATPGCLDACDANDDGTVDLADSIYVASAVTALGPPVPAPSGSCDGDPTADGLGCADFGACP